MVISWSILHEH